MTDESAAERAYGSHLMSTAGVNEVVARWVLEAERTHGTSLALFVAGHAAAEAPLLERIEVLEAALRVVALYDDDSRCEYEGCTHCTDLAHAALEAEQGATDG